MQAMYLKSMFLLLTSCCLMFTACADNHPKDTTEAPAAAAPVTTVPSTAPVVKADELPAFSLVDAYGKPVSLQSLKGKKLFVNLWATWCPPCKREMPSIQKLYKATDTSKVAFVMISVDDDFEKAIRYMASNKFQMPLYYPRENLPALFDVEGIPATFIFDETGKLIRRIDGSENYNTAEFRKLLN